MVDELRRPGTVPPGPESGSRPGSAHAPPSALIQSLQELRERVLERLDSLETLAQKRSACAPAAGESASLARTLELKRAELEETERRLCAQAERQEKEWSASLTQLEADRRLLAEAWERVERERIACSSAIEPHHQRHTQGPGPQKGAAASLPHASALTVARSATADSDLTHPIAESILKQFQTLCSDVRRNADDRRDSR
jgi:DNA repair exonuclease SbcCD ATPase subunit